MSATELVASEKVYGVAPVVKEKRERLPARERLRRMIADYEDNQFHPEETPNWPYPLRKLLTGRNRILIMIIENRERKSASGLITGIGNAMQFVPSAGYICKLSEYIESDPRSKDYMPILDGLRQKYDPELTGKPFLGPAVFFRPNSADVYDAPEAGDNTEMWAETEYRLTRGIYQPVGEEE
jgi:hypothetical protein